MFRIPQVRILYGISASKFGVLKLPFRKEVKKWPYKSILWEERDRMLSKRSRSLTKSRENTQFDLRKPNKWKLFLLALAYTGVLQGASASQRQHTQEFIVQV